ncbi:hypothetical protein [Oscillibacter sp.]|uniref:hypothetical protein n=1 Tax=Oscillibacter sp. TaxID=1945593 RepID=UPI00339143A8
MKALYYLAHEEDLQRFDTLFNELDVLATAIPIEKVPSLTAFVMKEKPIVQQDYILLDVSDMDWTPAHILSAVQQLRRFSSAQLVFLGKPEDETVELFGTLASVHHVSHLIMQRPGADVEAELRSCLTDSPQLPRKLQAIQEQMVHTAARTVSPLHIPDGLIIQVAVAGTMPRCGVTMQSIALYHYLKSLGWHPAVWDKCGRTLPLLQTIEEKFCTETESAVVVHGVPFCKEKTSQFNAYVLDYGMLTPENAAHFCMADLSVLVGCTKPWELPAFASALKEFLSHPCQSLITLASFSTQEDLDRLSKYFGAKNGLAPYQPNPWEPPEMQAYAKLLLPELKGICGEPHPEPECEVG